MPLASQLGFEESSLEISSSSTPPRAQGLSVIRDRDVARPSDSSSSGPIRRSRTRSLSHGPMVRSTSLQPAPTFASDVPGPSPSRSPQNPNVTHQELHLHQHAHRQQVVQVGVDPLVHASMQSQAAAAVSNARAETVVVHGEAEAVINSLRSENQQLGTHAATLRGEAEAAIQALRTENQQLGSQAEVTISSLRSENRQLGELNIALERRLEAQAKTILEQQEFAKTLHQQLIALQTHVQTADPVHNGAGRTAEASSASTAVDALQALAGEVGGTMKRIEQAIEVALSPKAKAKAPRKKNNPKDVAKAIAPSLATPASAKASGFSGLNAPSPVEFGLPPYACSRRNIFTGRSHSATPTHPPPPPSSTKPKPQIFDIGDEDDDDEPPEDEESEGEDGFEDDPVIPVVGDDPGDVKDYESSVYKYKDLKDIKLPQIPGSSVEFRAYRNAVLTQIASIDFSGKSILLKWLQKSLDPSGSIGLTRSLQSDCEGLPRLDGWLSANICDAKHLKGEWGLQAQSYLERCHAAGTMPSGRALLSILSRRYRVDKVRGPLVTLQSLFDLEPESYSYQSLVTFKQRVEYVLNGLPEQQWPDADTMFSWVYARLKGCRLLSRTIDRIKDSKPGSKRRTFEYVWNGLEEVLAEVREDRNEQALKESLKEAENKQKQKADAKAAAAKATPAVPPGKGNVRPKAKGQGADKAPKAPTKATPGVPDAGGLGKGKGKGEGKGKGKGKGGAKAKATPNKPPPPKDAPAESSGQRPPCFFYPKGTCTRGKDCPFEHVDAPKKAAP